MDGLPIKDRYFEMSFKYDFKAGDKVFFSYSVPYTYS
jgi:hypothetical protein